MEIETFDVELVKDSRGLGITIAGYVGEKTSGVRTFITILNLASKQTPTGICLHKIKLLCQYIVSYSIY